MHQKRFYVTCEVTGTYTEGEPTFMRQKKIVLLRKIVWGVEKVVNFKDFSRRLLKFKTF